MRTWMWKLGVALLGGVIVIDLIWSLFTWSEAGELPEVLSVVSGFGLIMLVLAGLDRLAEIVRVTREGR